MSHRRHSISTTSFEFAAPPLPQLRRRASESTASTFDSGFSLFPAPQFSVSTGAALAKLGAAFEPFQFELPILFPFDSDSDLDAELVSVAANSECKELPSSENSIHYLDNSHSDMSALLLIHAAPSLTPHLLRHRSSPTVAFPPAKIPSKFPRFKPSPSESALLNTLFDLNPFPSVTVQLAIASKFLLTERQVRIWFQNKRVAYKAGGIYVLKNTPTNDRLKKEAGLVPFNAESGRYFFIPRVSNILK
ncbi:hypothetical protein HDU79_006107 [Rhizoclosmatium sp. JEL0117]|nr:hypothetical protein HDU79_006107 [Rhizoclosmatium sp. JEL0117]